MFLSAIALVLWCSYAFTVTYLLLLFFFLIYLFVTAKAALPKTETGRSTGNDFEIYRSGRVEKILTGSTSSEPSCWV